MDLDKAKAAWNAQQIQEVEVETIVNRLARSAKRRRIVLVTCILNVVVSSAVLAFVFIERPDVSWSGVWPALLAQAIAACYLVSRLVRSFRPRRAVTLRESVRTALRDVSSQLRHMKVFAAMLLTCLVLVVAMLPGLYRSGKMNEQAILSFGLLCLAIVIGNAAALYFRYRRLLPQRDRLEAIESDLHD